ncbi:MAG: hypothetical protein IJS94_04870 [Clostridia bacterium]|nr:hypothetical protein [Clostridia bacterium]
MRNFWSFIGNDKYDIGCTGQTVYLYDKQGVELAKFKDLPYAYTAAVSPKGDIFVVKTTEGRMAVYSFDPPSLIKKFRFSKVGGAQDDNFCFSADGSELYNIERHIDSVKTALSVYDTSDFSLKRRILDTDFSTVLSGIENGEKAGEYYVLGYFRGETGAAKKSFVAKLTGSELHDIVCIPDTDYFFFESYVSLRMSGFTKMKYEWSYFLNKDLDELKAADQRLSQLWNRFEMQ